MIGVIQVLNKLHSDHFTESDENLLGAYSSLAGISIANAQAYDELQKERDLLEVRVKERTRDLEESRKKSDELLLNILPVTIADELKIDGKVKPKSYEMVSVLFTDFKGFTKISENMEPTEILNELDLCFYRFDMLMERFNLEKIKTIGDAYMCAGGIPTANQTNPIDAVLAGLEIQKFMDNLRISKIAEGKNYWELRLGIHTGPVIAGVVGQKKFAYDIWGDTVNTASRMESSGQPGKINVSSFTYKYIHTLFDCTYRGKIPAKNKGDIEMYFVERIKPELSIDGEGLQPNDKFLRLVEEYSQNGYPDSPNELNKSISS
ncbi:MAG: hypothetical protein H7A24_07855 [Leptospiraceae bacterium]|nr:hypothetical protein [Leptospiraceae bacterium]MCP5511779.1 hypothetical protein [Leptospiraceae bacterium]